MKIFVTQELDLGFELPRTLDEGELGQLEEYLSSFPDNHYLEDVQGLLDNYFKQEVLLTDGGFGNFQVEVVDA